MYCDYIYSHLPSIYFPSFPSEHPPHAYSPSVYTIREIYNLLSSKY